MQALMNLAQGARVLICGLISEYNAPAPVGARNVWQLLVKGANMRGFLVAHHVPRFAEGMAAMAGWLREGRIVHDEHVERGLDNALPAFLRLFHGTNDGKMVLEID
jgi:NADPH-dependent curcumin reductase CurA